MKFNFSLNNKNWKTIRIFNSNKCIRYSISNLTSIFHCHWLKFLPIYSIFVCASISIYVANKTNEIRCIVWDSIYQWYHFILIHRNWFHYSNYLMAKYSLTREINFQTILLMLSIFVKLVVYSSKSVVKFFFVFASQMLPLPIS